MDLHVDTDIYFDEILDSYSSEDVDVVFWAEEGGSMFLQTLGIYLHVHTALLPRRPT
jgi:hypothetical protein